MLFSIITLTKNSSSLIDNTLQSLYSQKNVDFEHIIQDCNSTDDTVDKVKKFSNKSTKIFIENDTGIFSALNKSLKKVDGDIIGLLHSGDYYLSFNTLSEIEEIFKQHNVDVVFCGISSTIKFLKYNIVRKWMPHGLGTILLNFGLMNPHPAIFINRETISKLGNYDETFKISSDYEYFLRIAFDNHLNCYTHKKIIIEMDPFGNSSNFNLRVFKKFKEDFLIAKKFFKLPLITVLLKRVIKIFQYLKLKKIR